MSKKTIIMTNKKSLKSLGKSICAACMAINSFFDKMQHKSEQDIIVSQFIFNKLNLIKHVNLLRKV